jgi:uncharacterized protein YjiS (DUF1127 family)
MSYTSAASHANDSKLVRLTSSVRRSWAEARRADRELMRMRTDLIRHVG